jgi:hypothetical protein
MRIAVRLRTRAKTLVRLRRIKANYDAANVSASNDNIRPA